MSTDPPAPVGCVCVLSLTLTLTLTKRADAYTYVARKVLESDVPMIVVCRLTSVFRLRLSAKGAKPKGAFRLAFGPLIRLTPWLSAITCYLLQVARST